MPQCSEGIRASGRKLLGGGSGSAKIDYQNHGRKPKFKKQAKKYALSEETKRKGKKITKSAQEIHQENKERIRQAHG